MARSHDPDETYAEHGRPDVRGGARRVSHDRVNGRESNSHAQRAIARSSAGAAYGNPGGQLPARRQPYKSDDQPVDRDDDHRSLRMLAHP